MTGDPVLLVEQLDDVITVLTLNRPQRRNALNIDLMKSLCGTLDALAEQPRRRLVLLRGAGAGFCSGLDLRETADPGLAEQCADWVARTFTTLKESPLITVALAQGAAFAGGAGLLACCDFVIAAEDLRIAFPEVRRGLIPALVAALLADRVREGDLKELFLIAEPVTAERGLTMGLVHRIVAADRMMDVALGLAKSILNGGPEAVRETKQWIRDLRTTEPGQRFGHALSVHKRVRESLEAQEGLNSFLEHRAPSWISNQ